MANPTIPRGIAAMSSVLFAVALALVPVGATRAQTATEADDTGRELLESQTLSIKLSRRILVVFLENSEPGSIAFACGRDLNENVLAIHRDVQHQSFHDPASVTRDGCGPQLGGRCSLT